jgi:oligo-1,6-glucosidase
MSITRKWWKESVIYQIYPRSFMDSNGDGIGDLEGIISKLDYLADLGIDIVWICPFFDSPNDDNGYDVRDYYAIGKEFGDMPTFDRLLEEMHKRGIKLMVDLVLNHTSDEHEWFVQSRSSKDNPYRDYYFWEKGENGESPTNWPSFFAGNVWEYDKETEEYYLHIFSKKQPDLNWENPKVRAEMAKIVNYWIDKGVDGFRLDVIPLISKRMPFQSTDLPRFNDIVQEVYSNGPKVHEYIREIAEKSFSRADVVTVGEGPGITTETGPLYVNDDRGELNMIFHLDHMFLGYGQEGRFDPVPYDLVDIKSIVSKWDRAMGEKGWISIFMDNHDFPRMVSRFGNDKKYRRESAKLLATMILTLRGTPCIYQGSEIAMANVEYDSIEDFDDVETKNFYRQMKEQGISDEEFRRLANTYGRDNARTPMQWSAKKNAGFTTGHPWLKVNPDHKEWNAEAALKDSDSVFYFYQKLIAFRKQNPVFAYGGYEDLVPDDDKLFIYRRWLDGVQFLVMLNFSDETQQYQFDIPIKVIATDNYGEYKNTGKLNPWQALVVEME